MDAILTAIDTFLSKLPPLLQVIFAFLFGLGIYKTIKYLGDRSAKSEEIKEEEKKE